MTGTPSAAKELETPYWRLNDETLPSGFAETLERLKLSVAPVIQIVAAAAPRGVAIIVVAQIVLALTVTASLILVNKVLGILFSRGANFALVEEALPLLLALGGVLAIKTGADLVSALARARLGPTARREAEGRLFRATLGVHLSSYDDPEFYDQLQRARDRGILHLEGSIDALVDTVGALLAVLGTAAALFILHPVLIPLMLLPLLPGAWGALAAAKVQYEGMSRTVSLTRQAGMYADLATRRNAAPEIRANQAQAYVLDRFNEAATRVRDHIIGISVSEAKISGVANGLAAIGLALSFVAMALMIQAGWLDLALASAAVVAFRTASASLNQLVRRGHELLGKALYIADFQQFLNAAARQCAPKPGLAAPQTLGVIEIKGLGFRYPGSGSGWALRDVTMTIRAGETIALVGENGSGKTTLAKLIAGLYQAEEGSVSWDGVDLRDISPAGIGDRISMVLQDPVRWPQSARANIQIGRHIDAHNDEERLIDVAEQSGAIDVIRALPEGWDTILSREFRGGHDLSAGQWQRLAVARGLYRDTPIVIWDEPTAPLDAKAELATYEALRRMGEGRTVVLITHRLTSVQGADRIIFLDQGRLREQGTHKELVTMGGLYAQLFAMQAKLYETLAL